MIKLQILSFLRHRVPRAVTAVFAAGLLLAAYSASAQSGKVTLPPDIITVKQALDEVERQTDYIISVSGDYLAQAKRIALPAGEIAVSELLAQALSGSGHTWEAEDRLITIRDALLSGDGDNARQATLSDDIDRSQMTFVPDPWSRDQRPFEDIINMHAFRMNTDVDGQDSTGSVVVNFRVNSSTVEYDYKDNARALDILGRIFADSVMLDNMGYMIIMAGSSPEGNAARNEKLAGERALALKSYIMSTFPFLDRNMIYTFSIGEDWPGLRRLVDEDIDTPCRSEVLELLDSDRNSESKKTVLKTIGGGKAYSYISKNMLPKLRGGAALSLYYKAEQEPVVVVEEEIIHDTVYIEEAIDPVPEPAVEPEPVTLPEPATRERFPLFAIKTNLLFDVLTAINLELEVPIGRHWSIAGEYVFPWWEFNAKHCIETRSGVMEVRYWPRSQEGNKKLTGWFVGLHGGGGDFDLIWGDKGYQAKWYHMAGISGGYAHAISKSGNWRMEYSLGVGYVRTNYSKYIPMKGFDEKWHLIRQKDGMHTWIGPTRAKVSLVWMINGGSNRKGGTK